MTNYIAKWPDKEGHIQFTKTENQTWSTLINRQLETIQNRACDEFIEGLELLAPNTNRIPQLYEINEKIKKTGWEMVSVRGTVQVDEFFTMLKNRQFPVANFIRVPEELDYLEQPDVFHEIFGHGPMLMHQAYADFVQWYGEMALTQSKANRRILSRLYWFSIEFGLVQTTKGLRIYGGGILSSHKETIFCLESDEPVRQAFNIQAMLDTHYDYNRIQDRYFILENLSALYTLKTDPILLSCLSKTGEDEQETFITC